MHRKTTLVSGLRVLTQKMDGTKAVTVLVLVKAGSRWEEKSINGVSHFLEHLFFKGAKKYKTAKAVSEAIDSVGGDFNAFTGKEYAGYYIKVAAMHLTLAVDVLSDMLLESRFDQVEIEKERGVILEELNMYQDSPMYQVGWNFEQGLFGDQPLGWDQIGTKDVLARLSREDFVAYRDSLYVPENMVLSIAGAVDHEDVLALIQEKFDMEEGEVSREMPAFDSSVAGAERVSIQNKKTEQAHLFCGVRALPAGHEDYYVLKVLASILGGNMSSRMFQSVREEQGLAYYISCGTEYYLDTGAFYTRAGVDVTRAPDAVRAIVREYDKIRHVEVSEAELKKGKEFLKGKLVLGLEDSESVAQRLAHHELLYEKVVSVKEFMKQIDRVTAADVKRVAAELLTEEALHLSVIGPYADASEFEAALRF